MKKKKSIFWTTILIILPLIIITDVIVLFGAHSFVSDMIYENYESDIQNAAEVTNVMFEDCDLKKERQARIDSEELCDLCTMLELPYIYVLEIDEKASTIKYLAIGTGEGASEEFLETRHIGDVVPTNSIDFYHAILNDTAETNIRHVDNKFDNTLIYYIRRTGGTAKNEVIAAEVSIAAVKHSLNRIFGTVVLIIFFFTLVIFGILALIIHNRIQKPAKLISQKMISFVHDRQKGFEKLEIKGSKEFSDMADAFNAMAQEIDLYLEEISEMNRQKAELHIARDIQKGLLEPPEHDCGTAQIKAFMLPARDVGGDLYDYLVLKDGKVCVIIADVSGKGISAALFMSRSITLIHQYAESGMSPSKILFEFNNHLAARNPNFLFITTFVGIFDPRTNELIYANAGHNFPYIISDKLIKLDGEQGTAAGIYEDQTYPEHTANMKVGDLLFLYTDGVTEAKSKDGGFFSDEALEKILTEITSSADKDAIPSVLDSLRAFSEGAKQADDITMLELKIEPHTSQKLHLTAEKKNLTAIYETITGLPLSDDLKSQLRFMAEEMFINICSYAYPDGAGTADIIIETDTKQATLTFIDTGIPFDPTQDIPDIEEYDIENAIGGLGRFLSFSYADAYSYRHDDDKNILTITKRIDTDSP